LADTLEKKIIDFNGTKFKLENVLKEIKCTMNESIHIKHKNKTYTVSEHFCSKFRGVAQNLKKKYEERRKHLRIDSSIAESFKK